VGTITITSKVGVIVAVGFTSAAAVGWSSPTAMVGKGVGVAELQAVKRATPRAKIRLNKTFFIFFLL
jgi:hypothetical protein